MKISVIIPVYNTKKYLSKCLESIINQKKSKFELEVLLIDDGSTDGSDIICDQYAQNNACIKVYHFENQGVSAARNHGLELAEGEWITFVDSDDYVDTNYLQLVTPEDLESAQIICFGFMLESKAGSKKIMINKENNSPCKCFLQRREVFGKFFKKENISTVRFQNYAIGEDLRFLIDVLCANENLKFVFKEECPYHYIHYNAESTVNNIKNFDKYFCSIENEIECFELLKAQGLEMPELRLIENAIYNFVKRFAQLSLKVQLKNIGMFINTHIYALRYRKIIFSYKHGIKRHIFHVVLVFFPILFLVFNYNIFKYEVN